MPVGTLEDENELDDDFGFQPESKPDDFGFQAEEAPAERAQLPPLFDTTQTPIQMSVEQVREQQGLPRAIDPDIPTLSQGKPKGVLTRFRESLSPLIGPTEEQRMSESVPYGTDARGETKYEYRPAGSRVEQEGFFPAMSKPMVAIPKASHEADDPLVQAAAKSVYNVGAGFAEFLESPLGIATGGAGSLAASPKRATAVLKEAREIRNLAQESSKLTRGLQKTGAAGFAADIAGHVPEAARAAGEKSVTGTTGEAFEAGLQAAVSVVLPAVLGKHATARAEIPRDIQRAAAILPRTAAEVARITGETKPKSEVSDASKVRKAEEIHEPVPSQPVEGQPAVPAEEGGPGVQPQPAGRIPEAAPKAGEPSAPVRPAEAVKSPESIAQQISNLKPEEFASHKWDVDARQDAIRLGGSLDAAKPEQLEMLRKHEADAKEEMKSVPVSTDPAAFAKRAALGLKKQYFSEAIRAATHTGNDRIVNATLGEGHKAPFPEGKTTTESAQTGSKLVESPKPDWQVTVQGAQGEVPGFVQIVDPKATEQSKSPTMESLRAAGHEVPDFSKLPQGKYTYEEAVAKSKEAPAAAEPKPTETTPAPVSEKAPEQKYRIGNSPQTYTLVEKLAQSEAEKANNEQPVRVKNDRTGEESTILEQDLTAVQARTAEEKAAAKPKVDLDQQLEEAGLDPSVFSNASQKREALKRQKELVGLGGAVPSEFAPSRQGATGIKNAEVDANRQARGEEPLLEPARLSNPVVWDRAMARIDAEPAWQDRLIMELREAPRTLTPEETIAMDHRYVDLQNEYAKTTRELAAAYDESKTFPNRAEAIPELEARLATQGAELLDFEQITKNVGTEWGRSGQIRQRLLNEDYSLARMVIQKRAANEGRELTPKENETIARQAREIEELQAQLKESEARNNLKGADEALKQSVPELVKEAMAEDAQVKRTRRGASPEEARDSAEASLRSKVSNGATPPELTNVIQRLARAFVRLGIKERVPLVDAVHNVVQSIKPDMAWRQTMDAISGYGDFRPLSQDQISVQLRDLKGQMQQAGKLLDMFAGEAPKKTGPERRTPTNLERGFIQLVNEAKKRFGFRTTDPANQLKGALQSLKTRLRNQISDFEEQIASRTRRVDERAPVPEDAESIALKAQRDKLKAEFDEMFGKPEISDEQRVKLALASLDRQSVEIERQIKDGDIFSVPRTSKTPANAAIDAAKAKRDALKLEREYLREAIQPTPRLTKEEIALKALQTRMQNQIVELTDKLAKGDFSKKERKPVRMDDSTKQISFKLEKVKRDYHEGLMNDRLARRPRWKKVLAGVGEVVNVMRALKTSFDLPPIFRQGGFMTMSDIPTLRTRSIKALGTGLQAMRPFKGKAEQHATMEEIQSRPNAPLYRSSGLYLSERTGKLSQMEEAYMSRWATKIPGVGMSERGYTTYLNKLRADSFDAMAKSLSRNGQTPTPAEAKVIANFVNAATGRGRIGKNDIVGEVLDKTFFAPRYWASRIQMLVGQPIWTTSAPFKGTMRVRAAVAGEYARALAGMAVVYALAQAAGAVVEKDTRSSDFGKLKFGDTRSDMMAGLQQQLVFLSRFKTGQTKNSRGRIVPLADQDGKKVPFGGDDTDDLIKRMLLTKLAPVPSMVLDERRGKNLVGEPLTIGSRIQAAIGPMTMMDVFKAMKEEGVPENVALSLLSFLGAGMQTYPDRNPKPEPAR